MECVKLKFHTNGSIIELELPAKTSLLRAALKIATNQQEMVRREYPPDECFEEHQEQVPKEFSKIKGFKKIFDRLRKQLGGYYGETWTINNITKIENDSQTQSINRKALDIQCRGILEGIHRNNVKAVAIHITGCLSNEDNAYIIDRISRDFNCTIIRYFSVEKLMVTEIDIGFFGNNICKPPWMMFMGGE
jgi:hypothetical protein